MTQYDMVFDGRFMAETLILRAMELIGFIVPGFNTPGQGEIETCLFHLEGMTKESIPAMEHSQSLLAFELARRIAPAFDCAVPLMGMEIKWYGDTNETILPALQMIAGLSFTDQELDDADDFARGNQWDEKIKAERIAAERPCLVANRIVMMVSKSLAMESIGHLEYWQFRYLRAAIVSRNRDAQKLYNYQISALAEIAAQKESVLLNPKTGECTCPRCKTGLGSVCASCLLQLADES